MKKLTFKENILMKMYFLRISNKPFVNRNNGKEEFKTWKLYKQKASAKYKTLKSAYIKAGIRIK
ncbi:MAG: hypothetical protein COA79_16210 [Planctomycetota bacterium]|nr:MAG: hypothetical protein COA79_16210 [Planctomycetota bacterium]